MNIRALGLILSLVKAVKCLADIGFEAGPEFQIDVGDKTCRIHFQEIGVDDDADAAGFFIDIRKTQYRADSLPRSDIFFIR